MKLSVSRMVKAEQKQNETKTAIIELSEKVCDSDLRLQTTLLHEMCHVAAWLLDGERKPPHGPAFWKYAKLATTAFPSLAVTTCHSYSVHKPHKFQCTDVSCATEYTRHSKKGIDLERHRCGICKSKLEYLGYCNAEGAIRQPRSASGFSAYVKENFATTKLQLTKKSKTKTISHAEIMKELARTYKERAEENNVVQLASGLGQLRI